MCEFVDHRGSARQRINGTSLVFFAMVQVLVTFSVLGGINFLPNTPSVLSTLQESVHAMRAMLDRLRLEALTIPSHFASPNIHLSAFYYVVGMGLREMLNPETPAPRNAS